MSKCVCHINGYAIKDATARTELETLKREVESLKESSNTGDSVNVNEAYITSNVTWHNSATNMLCFGAPYANNTIVAMSLWFDMEHYYLKAPVTLSTANAITLVNPSTNVEIVIYINNFSTTKVGDMYYGYSESISYSTTSSSGNEMLCSMLIKSTEA